MYVHPHLTRLLSSPERAAQVCNPDTPAATYDTGDTWFPSNSSRLIVDDGISAILRSKAESKPFYLNLWFHISHAPMRPTAAQYQALADCEYRYGLPPRSSSDRCWQQGRPARTGPRRRRRRAATS